MSAKLFVGQVPRHMDEEQLMPLFSQYGSIVGLSIIRDKATGHHKGCAFLTFTNKEEAGACIDALHNKHTFSGMPKPLQVKYSGTQSEDYKDYKGSPKHSEHKLFVGMIPKAASSEDILPVFEAFGDIEELIVLRGPDGQSRGCAFLRFVNRESAVQCITSLNGSLKLPGAPSNLVVKFAESEREKDKHRQLQLQKNTKSQAHAQAHQLQQNIQLLQLANLAQQLCAHNPHNWGQLPPPPPLPPPVLRNSFSTPPPNFGPRLGGNSGTDLAPSILGGIGGRNGGMGGGGMGGGGMHGGGMHGEGMHGGGMHGGGMHGGRMGGGINGPLGGYGGMNAIGGPNGFDGMGGLITDNTEMPGFYGMSGMNRTSGFGPHAHHPRNSGYTREGPDGATLFIYHLPPEFTDEDVYHAFSPFGNILSSQVYFDKQTNESRCFGFVCYDTPEAAQVAIAQMDGFFIHGYRLKVHLKIRARAGRPY